MLKSPDRKLICYLLLLIFVVFFKSAQGAASPWLDVSYCSPNDTLPECSMKKAQCAPVNQIMKAGSSGGWFTSLTKCSNSTGVALDDTIFISLGMSFIRGNPESVLDNVTSEVRECVSNSTGLFGLDKKLNRTAVMKQLALQPLGAPVIIPIVKAVKTCPEPVDFQMSTFMACLRKTCMENADIAPVQISKKKPKVSTLPLTSLGVNPIPGLPFNFGL